MQFNVIVTQRTLKQMESKLLVLANQKKKNLLSANGLHTQKKGFQYFLWEEKNVTGTENARKY